MKPEANFDILFVCDRLDQTYGKINFVEIQSLCYLSQLLSLYDGCSTSDWGYYFINPSIGLPFSGDIQNEIERLIDIGHLDFFKDSESITINQKGATLLQLVSEMKLLKWRKKYLQASVDSALSIPLPTLVSSVNHEPMLNQSSINHSRELLGTGINIDMLYEQFEALNNVLNTSTKDIWIAAILWLKYLNAVAKEET